MSDEIDITTGARSGHELSRLSRCKPKKGTPWQADPATSGHVELIEMADKLAAAVLDQRITDAWTVAEGYRSLRIQAAVQAGQP